MCCEQTLICIVVKIQTYPEFDAKDSSPFLSAPDGEAQEYIISATCKVEDQWFLTSTPITSDSVVFIATSNLYFIELCTHHQINRDLIGDFALPTFL